MARGAGAVRRSAAGLMSAWACSGSSFACASSITGRGFDRPTPQLAGCFVRVAVPDARSADSPGHVACVTPLRSRDAGRCASRLIRPSGWRTCPPPTTARSDRRERHHHADRRSPGCEAPSRRARADDGAGGQDPPRAVRPDQGAPEGPRDHRGGDLLPRPPRAPEDEGDRRSRATRSTTSSTRSSASSPRCRSTTRRGARRPRS